MSLAEYFCRPSIVWIFQIWPYLRHNPIRWTMLHVPLRDLTAGETYTRRPNEIGTRILQSTHPMVADPGASLAGMPMGAHA